MPPATSAAQVATSPQPSTSDFLSIGLPLKPPATVTVYSNISVPYPSTIYELSTALQTTTIVESSTVYVPSPTTLVQLSSILVRQPTTVFDISTIFVSQPAVSCQQPVCLPIVTTVSQVVTLTPPTPLPSTTTLILPQATVTSLLQSIDYIYATRTQFITGEFLFPRFS